MPSTFTETEICNRGLDILGQRNILNLDEPTKEGKFCKRNYPMLRDVVLRAHPWNFAINRTSLAALSTAPSWGFSKQATLPADYLKLVSVQDDIPHKVEGGLLLSDSNPIYIQYIFRNTNVATYDALFIEALAARIAAEGAVKLMNDKTYAKTLYEVYLDKIGEARFADATEDTPDEMTADAWINSRI